MAGEAVVHYRGEIASHTRGGAHLAKRVIFLLEYELIYLEPAAFFLYSMLISMV